MRNRKTVQLARGLSVTVHEITVADVIDFLMVLGNVVYGEAEIDLYIKSQQLDMWQRAKGLVIFHKAVWWIVPDSWLMKWHSKAVYTLFMEVNKAYFGKDDDKKPQLDPKRLRTKKASAIAEGLKDSLQVLIREGHTNPQNYGWGFFVNACEFQEKLIKESKKNG